MARLYPMLSDAQLGELPSQAEASVYRSLRDSLDNTYVVIHGKSYIAPRKDGGHKDGEADFIIFSAKYGLLIVEVKGGGVTYDPARGWKSIDRQRQTHEIKDPVAQAKSQKYAIFAQLQANHMWTALHRRISLGHAVIFPDISSIPRLGLPECPNEIIGDKAALGDIENWLDRVFQHWTGQDDTPLGHDGLQAVERILCRPIEVRPLLRDILASDDQLRIRLTNEQASVLRTLGRHKRAAIVGAAGTGKTVLAVEKARMLAELGVNVLLLCYNKALGATLERQFSESDQVLACTFHQFCQHCIRKCVESGKPNPMEKVKAEEPNSDEFDIQMPLAAFYAIEEMDEALKFDAIIVDEGQDFGDEYWLPIEMALRNSDQHWLYVFYDENQRLYTRASSFPILDSDTFPLTKNCRNSKPVHDFAYQYYKGEPVDDSGIDGLAPIPFIDRSPETQAKQIARQITKIIHDEGVNPESIAVLVAGKPKESFYNLLLREPLPRPVRWSQEEHFQNNSVLMDTVKRFKGLERDVIFLWVDQVSLSSDTLMYVGISRAKSVLYVVGSNESLRLLQLV